MKMLTNCLRCYVGVLYVSVFLSVGLTACGEATNAPENLVDSTTGILSGEPGVKKVKPGKPAPVKFQLIYSVDSMTFKRDVSKSVQLTILASGTVTTSGWSNAELQPFSYIQPPQDGIYDYSFVATPPDGIVLQVLTPISVSYDIQRIPDDMKGVRIHTKTNQMSALLSDSDVL